MKNSSSKPNKSKSKIGWNFDNSYARLGEELGKESGGNFYTRLNPTPVRNPRLVIVNYALGKFLGLDLQAADKNELAKIFAGNLLPEGAEPLAQTYAGHQYGNFVILGDGRAHLLGEQITPSKERFDIQLKGSGQTPYSRQGDGRATLAPMLREYIISEAMFALGIPTTRSLAVVTTGEMVFRETPLPGASLCRVAASHIRVGTFQYFAAKSDNKSLKQLANYVIQRHYSEVVQDANPYLSLFKTLIHKQIKLVVEWLRVGFVHGVMNSDNMTIAGETIDYGPCAFMDRYDAATVFSSIDHYGRYAFANQPVITKWNLTRFAEAILPLLDDDESKAVSYAEAALESFDSLFVAEFMNMMRGKLGLIGVEKNDEELIITWLKFLQNYRLDYTNSFRELSCGEVSDERLRNDEQYENWWQDWMKRRCDAKRSVKIMKENNPAIIPRNHKVEEALEAAVNGDLTVLHNLLKLLSKPYMDNPSFAEYKTPSNSTQPYRTFCGT